MKPRTITVAQLITILQKTDPNAAVLMPYNDHSYRSVYPIAGTALYQDGCWTEDHGDDCTPEGNEFGKRYSVVVFS